MKEIATMNIRTDEYLRRLDVVVAAENQMVAAAAKIDEWRYKADTAVRAYVAKRSLPLPDRDTRERWDALIEAAEFPRSLHVLDDFLAYRDEVQPRRRKAIAVAEARVGMWQRRLADAEATRDAAAARLLEIGPNPYPDARSAEHQKFAAWAEKARRAHVGAAA